MFARHRVVAFGGAFHVPDVSRYPALFAWDSGYHALSLRHLDLNLALQELSTLYEANRLRSGLLSHQRFIPGAGDHQHFIEELFGPMFVGDLTPFVDPPTSAYAGARLSRVVGPPADQLLSAVHQHLAALINLRALDGDVLPVALHPFETGTENSVYVQSVLRHTEPSLLAQFKDLTVSAITAEMSPKRALVENHGFVVHDPTMCGWLLLALEEFELACHDRGWPKGAAWAEEKATEVAEAVVDRLWWKEGHLFVAYDLATGSQVPGVGAMGLIPAASRILAARGYAADVTTHHVHPGAVMWGPKGFAAGSVQPGRGVESFVQWDGNAVWGATVYWAHLAALRAGLPDHASQLRTDLRALVDDHGFREFYDAWSGSPGGAGVESGFTWPALLLEMEANERTGLDDPRLTSARPMAGQYSIEAGRDELQRCSRSVNSGCNGTLQFRSGSSECS